MQTRTYADLLELTQALCGVDSFSANEEVRIKALINRRATKAYLATNFWPRFLTVGEERAVDSSLISYDQTGLSSIDTFLRVHVTCHSPIHPRKNTPSTLAARARLSSLAQHRRHPYSSPTRPHIVPSTAALAQTRPPSLKSGLTT